MDKPAFFVDGIMEKIILQKIGVSTKIITTDLNGKSVTVGAIAKKLASFIRVINGRFRPIIIIIDREDRPESADEIVSNLFETLRHHGISDQLIIGVSDRMTENWILADWESFAKHTNTKKKKPVICEGNNGVGIIKQHYPQYQKTTDGVNLFLNAKASSIKNSSPSFSKLIDQILPLGYTCHWINR